MFNCVLEHTRCGRYGRPVDPKVYVPWAHLILGLSHTCFVAVILRWFYGTARGCHQKRAVAFWRLLAEGCTGRLYRHVDQQPHFDRQSACDRMGAGESARVHCSWLHLCSCRHTKCAPPFVIAVSALPVSARLGSSHKCRAIPLLWLACF